MLGDSKSNGYKRIAWGPSGDPACSGRHRETGTFRIVCLCLFYGCTYFFVYLHSNDSACVYCIYVLACMPMYAYVCFMYTCVPCLYPSSVFVFPFISNWIAVVSYQFAIVPRSSFHLYYHSQYICICVSI